MTSRLPQPNWSELPGGKPLTKADKKAAQLAQKNGSPPESSPTSTAVDPGLSSPETLPPIEPEPLPAMSMELVQETLGRFENVDFSVAIEDLKRSLRGYPPSAMKATRRLHTTVRINFQTRLFLIELLEMMQRTI